jgi:ketosteroid isomerase-like protein
LTLYSSDAIVLRANLAPAHGRTAIRQLLQAALQAGLGDVELEPADAGVLGDIACLTGKSRMLVPTAPGKRHEETGKFLIVARRESGDWKILADSWCIDSPPKQTAPLSAPAPAVRTPRSKENLSS